MNTSKDTSNSIYINNNDNNNNNIATKSNRGSNQNQYSSSKLEYLSIIQEGGVS